MEHTLCARSDGYPSDFAMIGGLLWFLLSLDHKPAKVFMGDVEVTLGGMLAAISMASQLGNGLS